jgi:hypothetical protein
MEHDGQDDAYDYLQNRFLHFEHAGRGDISVVDEMNLKVIKSDENHCEMAQSAEINDLIEKTDWGNESSMKYFLMENQACWHTVSSIECNKTLRSEKSDIDYHLLRTSLFSNMPCKKVKMMEMYMKEMIKRVQQDQPVILSHSDVRRCYTKGSGSIYRQMPVPLGMSGGKALSHFAIFSC